MTNLEIAKLLRKISAAYTILGKNRFKIIAYDNAATAVEHSTSEIKDLWDDDKLDTVPGLGASIQSHLDELIKTGKSRHFSQILSKVNPAIFPLLEVPGIGPKKAFKLVETLHIENEHKVLAELEQAAKSHKIAEIADFGAKSEQDILAGIERYKKGSIKEKRMVLPTADAIADEVIAFLRSKLPGKFQKIDKLGSLRRQVATIGDIDLAVSTVHPEEVLNVFVIYPKKVELIERGPTGASLLLASGRQCDLRVGKPATFGAMLQYFTGSKYHNIRLRDYALKKGFSVNEYGITRVIPKSKASSGSLAHASTSETSSEMLKQVQHDTKKIQKFETEEKLYNFLGLDYIPPELREDQGEIEAAENDTLPNLVELKDVKGDLQMHSNFDLETSHDPGRDSISEMRAAGEKLGYDYIAITNHNPSSKHSQDQIITKLKAQKTHIDAINKSTKNTRVLSLLEVDISPDGSLPVPQEGLELLDGCLVSIHSNFQMSKQQMTARVLMGLANPVARIFAHPTGRLLGEREGYELDWEAIFKFCLDHDKALEINSYPNRLDLPDTLVHEAVKKGVKLSLGTDSHDKDSLGNIKYGVSVARRGWASKENIINCQRYDKILKWLHQRR